MSGLREILVQLFRFVLYAGVHVLRPAWWQDSPMLSPRHLHQPANPSDDDS